MGTLYLVRHGQASFGADDYDQLSELGHRQSVRLGEYFAHQGLRFDGLIAGTLRRHRQTLAGILQGMDQAGEHLSWEGLNEYDSGAVIAAIHPEPLPRPDSPEAYRHHFRLLRDGLAQWMAGAAQPRGMPSWAEFLAGVAGALDHVRANHYGQQVLMVTSGGPIATAVGHVLGASPQATIELNMRLRNTGLTEFAFTPKRHSLVSFNCLPHLDAPGLRGWITHA
ncbi:histidine phosphatase family protein [Ramlibacter tataouinensis]|uniref:histidine phosphatase family protein n=1 Tax=Ramlibacter tataouinensis TaxID=94132 RepID=UPI0022F3AB12|nr:histidine phosphatase family protein [Ramlibacter tataouinensis]WBY00410.1 histidine phosphatase family protein [Ramlibacter tataouinensis]